MVQPCRSCILEVQCLKLSALCNCYFAVVFALQVRKKISRTHAHDTLIEQLGGALRVCCQKHGSKRIIPTALRSNFRMHGDRRESPPPASVLRCGLLARLVAHFAKRETRTSEEFLRANFRNEGGDRTRFRKYFHGRERVQIRSRFLADFREYDSGNATRIFCFLK